MNAYEIEKHPEINGGVKKVTVATYCVFSRTRYVHNPGVEGKKLISTHTYDSYC